MNSIDRCDPFFEKVSRSFQGLMNQYDFTVIEKDSPDIFDNCLIVLQSNNCRIRIVRDRGSIHIEVSPSIIIDSQIKHSPWYYVGTIIDYINQSTSSTSTATFRYGITPEYLIGEMKTDWELSDAASKLEPYWEKIFHFLQRDNFLENVEKLEDFVQRRKLSIWRPGTKPTK